MRLSRHFINPAGDILSEFDRLFRHACRGFNPSGMGNGSRAFSAYEADDAWQLRADLPGFRKDDLDISLEDDVLTVKAERKDEEHGFAGSFEQSLRIPDEVKRADIAANLDHGVLQITLPNTEESQPKTLQISVN